MADDYVYTDELAGKDNLLAEMMKPNVQIQPRQAGKANARQAIYTFTPKQDVDYIHGDIYRELRLLKPEYLEIGTVVRWISRGTGPTARPYTYAGVWTGSAWFITGTGQFYGANQFSHDLFIEHVLAHSDVRDIQVSTEWLASR